MSDYAKFKVRFATFMMFFMFGLSIFMGSLFISGVMTSTVPFPFLILMSVGAVILALCGWIFKKERDLYSNEYKHSIGF